MSSDPNDRSDSPDARGAPAEPPQVPDPASETPRATEPEQAGDPPAEPEPTPQPAAPEQPTSEPPEPDSAEPAPERPPRRRILIGSQRDAAAYRPKPKRDSIRIVGMKRRTPPTADKDKPKARSEAQSPDQADSSREQPAGEPEGASRAEVAPEAEPQPVPQAAVRDETPLPQETSARDEPTTVTEEPPEREVAAAAEAFVEQAAESEPAVGKRFPPPNIRDRLPPDLEEEFQEALADAPLDDLIASGDEVTKQPMLEADSRHTGRVVMIRREDAFVELGGREQGILPLKQFDEPPELDSEVEIRVIRFNREDGLYELTRAGAAASVADWADLEEGMLVEVRVTGHNSGGLECDVNHMRGFIPVSQISLYRVEDLTQFVDEKFTCLVTEANPRRRNLVLSRRAVLEREREEARRDLLESLEPGQVREGVVRKLVDFGAFVDLGGVDGLVHVSQLAWGRVNHPREVLQVGQTIEVKINSVDKDTARIGLAYRDLMDNPWADVEMKYPVTSTVHGEVTKLMEYGAFVQLEPGVEGLVHISELSYKRVRRVSDVVNEGDAIDAVVLSVDAEAQRISLSMKDLVPEPEPPQPEQPPQAEQPAPPSKSPKKPAKPLQGGLGRSKGGQQFGLKW